MGFKFVSVAVLAALLGSASAEAQSVSRIGGPANPPPPGYAGQQFVDNRGCVFLRAGNGGQTIWVPRVGRDRKAMCGVPSSGAARGAIEVASAAEMTAPAAPVAAAPRATVAPVRPAPAPTVFAQAPMATVATTTASPRIRVQQPSVVPSYSYVPAQIAPRPAAVAPVVRAAPRQPAPYAQQAPRGTYEVAQGAGPGRGQIGCTTSAPVAERVKLRNGGTAVVCTRGDGSLDGWRPPVYPRVAGVGASLTDPVIAANRGGVSYDNGTNGGSYQGGNGQGQVYARAAETVPTPPKGYKLAWDDDRLNPNRGKGTASGWAAQDEVWTRKVPSSLVADAPQPLRKKKIVYVTKGSNVVVSTKGQPTTPVKAAPVKKVAKGGAYIQVGTFGVASNADGAASRLRGIGLPVARAKITSGGKPMQIVLAGPFGSAADAAQALSMARGAGFGDAFIR